MINVSQSLLWKLPQYTLMGSILTWPIQYMFGEIHRIKDPERYGLFYVPVASMGGRIWNRILDLT